MSERERVHTRNFRHPVAALPVGTEMESPSGIPCKIVGRSDLKPGRLVVEFAPAGGREFVQHMWPSKLEGFKVNGEVL